MRFSANNGLSSSKLFLERKKYKLNVQLPYAIDLWYDKPLYGKIDRQGYAASLSETNLKQLRTTKTLFAPDFVADAYSALLEYLALKTAQTRTVLPAPFRDLELEAAWVSANALYHLHMQTMYYRFFAAYVPGYRRDKKILDFDSFTREFLSFVRIAGESIPICKSSFILSSICPSHISGLFLDIQKDSNEDDLKKQMLLENSAFNAFTEAASRFGFMINKNNPYQLVFNVGSKQGAEFMKKYGIEYAPGSSSDLFDVYYYEVETQQDIELLKAYLTQFYTAYIQARPWVKVGCKTITRSPVTETVLNNDIWWLKVLTIVRLYESGLEPNEHHGLIEKVVGLSVSLDTETALKYLETVIEKRAIDPLSNDQVPR
jgi:hypothetical protein